MKKGFTLLELIIALGIGALIITTVMISAQGAERSSRDGRRRADLNKLSGALEQWANNHNGLYPKMNSMEWSTDGQSGAFVSEGYFNAPTYNDPKSNSNHYIIDSTAATTACTWSDPSVIHYNPDSSNRSYKLAMCIESGVYTLESKN